MKKPNFALGLLCALGAWGQNPSTQAPITDYLGPGVLSRGAGSIGQRAGQDVDLRVYGNASSIYDTGFNPVSVDANGAFQNVKGLYGIEVGLGAYGRHTFRHGILGLDYMGTYRHYTQNQFFNGANHQFTLGHTWQKSRRIIFDFRQSAGSSAYANTVAFGLPIVNDGPVDATTLLFDNRTTYLQSNVDMTYLASQRTSYTMGGNWLGIYRQSSAIAGMRGYTLRGNIDHRFSTRTSAGIAYSHEHYDFPGTYGGSDIDTMSVSYSRLFGRSWTTSISGGVYRSQVEGVNQVNVEPAIALLLGVNTTTQPFYRVNVLPYGRVALVRRFQNAAWSLSYDRSVSPGNGVYLTSQQQSLSSGFSYSGVRKWTFSINAGYGSLNSLGLTVTPYSQYYGSTDVTYAITDSFHIGGAFTARHQEVASTTFRPNSTRSMISLMYSPGNIPISFR